VFRRRKVTPYSPLFQSQLLQALAHLQLAGTHAAVGAAGSAGAGAARLRGRWNASMEALAPMRAAARLEAQRAAKAAEKSKAKANKKKAKKGSPMARRWPYIVGVVAAGAAVGAGAYAVRKRRNARSAEETAHALAGDARDLVASASSTVGGAVTEASQGTKDAWVKTKDPISRDGKTKVLEPTGM
jgi:hypothetical protein